MESIEIQCVDGEWFWWIPDGLAHGPFSDESSATSDAAASSSVREIVAAGEVGGNA